MTTRVPFHTKKLQVQVVNVSLETVLDKTISKELTLKQPPMDNQDSSVVNEESTNESIFIALEESNSTLTETHCSNLDKDKAIHECLVQEEEKVVQRARLVILLVVAVCAVAISISVFRIASCSNQKSFELNVRNSSE